jgi:hypothetical protein
MSSGLSRRAQNFSLFWALPLLLRTAVGALRASVRNKKRSSVSGFQEGMFGVFQAG